MSRNHFAATLAIAILATVGFGAGCAAKPEQAVQPIEVVKPAPEPEVAEPAPPAASRDIDGKAFRALAQEVARMRADMARLDEARAAAEARAIAAEKMAASVGREEEHSGLVQPLEGETDGARAAGAEDPAPDEGGIVVLGGEPDSDEGSDPPQDTEGGDYPPDERPARTDEGPYEEPYVETAPEPEVIYVESEPTIIRETVYEEVVYEGDTIYQYVPVSHVHYIGCGHHYYGCSCHSWYYDLHSSLSFGYRHGGHHYSYGYGYHTGFHADIRYVDHDDHHDRHGHHGHRASPRVGRGKAYVRGFRQGFANGVDAGINDVPNGTCGAGSATAGTANLETTPVANRGRRSDVRSAVPGRGRTATPSDARTPQLVSRGAAPTDAATPAAATTPARQSTTPTRLGTRARRDASASRAAPSTAPRNRIQRPTRATRATGSDEATTTAAAREASAARPTTTRARTARPTIASTRTSTRATNRSASRTDLRRRLRTPAPTAGTPSTSQARSTSATPTTSRTPTASGANRSRRPQLQRPGQRTRDSASARPTTPTTTRRSAATPTRPTSRTTTPTRQTRRPQVKTRQAPRPQTRRAEPQRAPAPRTQRAPTRAPTPRVKSAPRRQPTGANRRAGRNRGLLTNL